MKTNAQCPLESFRLPWLEIHSYLTKASCFILLLMLQLFLYWSPVSQKNGKHSDHPSELPYESKCSVPSVKFSDALVRNSFTFDKSFKHCILLMQQLLSYWSLVGQKNGKYSDLLSELPYENKCSMPCGRF